jgi:hypothetical protein
MGGSTVPDSISVHYPRGHEFRHSGQPLFPSFLSQLIHPRCSVSRVLVYSKVGEVVTVQSVTIRFSFYSSSTRAFLSHMRTQARGLPSGFGFEA